MKRLILWEEVGWRDKLMNLCSHGFDFESTTDFLFLEKKGSRFLNCKEKREQKTEMESLTRESRFHFSSYALVMSYTNEVRDSLILKIPNRFLRHCRCFLEVPDSSQSVSLSYQIHFSCRLYQCLRVSLYLGFLSSSLLPFAASMTSVVSFLSYSFFCSHQNHGYCVSSISSRIKKMNSCLTERRKDNFFGFFQASSLLESLDFLRSQRREKVFKSERDKIHSIKITGTTITKKTRENLCFISHLHVN
jgi:hypothetical protein